MSHIHPSLRQSWLRVIQSWLLLASFITVRAACWGQDAEFPLPEGKDDPPLADPLGVEFLGNILLESFPVEAGVNASEPIGGSPLASAVIPSERIPSDWHVAPHLDLSATYDDNIFIQRDREVSDLIFTAAPGITAGFWESEKTHEGFLDREHRASGRQKDAGRFLVADYTAILLGFVRNSEQNSIDHEASIDGQWQFEKLQLGARSRYEARSEASLDIGNRVRRNVGSYSALAAYQFSERTSLEAEVSYTHQAVEGYARSTAWQANGYLHYEVSPLLRASFGMEAGHVEVEGGADRVFERLLVRATHSLSEKLTFDGEGGVEFRNAQAQGRGDRIFVFDVSTKWKAAAGTELGVKAYRRVEASALSPEQDFALTGVALTFRRSLRAGLHATFAGGYHRANYNRVANIPKRSDDFLFLRPGVLYNFARWGNAELTYEYRFNKSSLETAAFENNRVSFGVSLTY